ncbi:MAG: AAA family ATPase [Magnetococcales bacterium]|nr:AAA family ATPase [Magnetococcales bacterium]
MIITMENVGPIKHYQFDLDKDFHLLIGDNSVGKSYAISIVYLVLKSFCDDDKIYYYNQENNHGINVVDDENSILTERYYDKIKIFLYQKNIEKLFMATFNTISDMKNRYNTDESKIIVSSSVLSLEYIISNCVETKVKIHKKIKSQDSQQIRDPQEFDDRIIFYCKNPVLESNDLSVFFNKYFVDEIKKYTQFKYFLPASRSGLYQALSAFNQILLELAKSRSFLKSTMTLPGISEPLSDYFMALLDSGNNHKNIQDLMMENNAVPDEKLVAVVRQIEKEILKGTIEFDKISKKIIFISDHANMRMDLSATSSMVSEVSPIWIFIHDILQLKVEKGDIHAILFIEEPEAHLHPEVQVKLTEIFAGLIQCGVKVVMTSHSNYIFNKVNNVLLAGQLDPAQVQVTVMRMEEGGSVGHPLPVDALGVDDENFVDVAERLYEEKMALFARISG